MTTIDTTPAYGGQLVNTLADTDRAAEIRRQARDWPSWYLSRRQLCDLELLSCGAFSPLTGFLGREDYTSVCEAARLADGTLWPIPITLDIASDVLAEASPSDRLALRDPDGTLLASLLITDAWQPDPHVEAATVFGTTDPTHPSVHSLQQLKNRWYVSGVLEVLQLPNHHDFHGLRLTPAAIRSEFARRGWSRVIAFQTRNPMHRVHQQLTLRAAQALDANLLIHPVVGVGKPGDVDTYTRVRCYRAILPTYPDGTAMLSLLPLAMRMAGPREALWHAIVRRNYGATHFIVGRDHAGPGIDSKGRPFYGPYDSQRLVQAHADEIGIQVVPFKRLVYVSEWDSYCAEDDVPPGTHALSISGTELRQRLATGADLPSWFTPPEVASELRRRFPARAQRGFTVVVAGRRPIGTSAVANALAARILERSNRQVTFLDGGHVGGSPVEHSANGSTALIAGEVTKHRGIAICTVVPPRGVDGIARSVRSAGGGLVVVNVTGSPESNGHGNPADVEERSDLYSEAPDIEVDLHWTSIASAVDTVIEHLKRTGYWDSGGNELP